MRVCVQTCQNPSFCENAGWSLSGVFGVSSEHEVMKPVAREVLVQESGATGQINYNSLKSAQNGENAITRACELGEVPADPRNGTCTPGTPPGGLVDDLRQRHRTRVLGGRFEGQNGRFGGSGGQSEGSQRVWGVLGTLQRTYQGVRTGHVQ